MDGLRLHRRSIFTGKVEVVTDANVIAVTDRCGIVEMTLDTDTFAMHEAVDTRDFDDAERDPITTTYPNVAAFIAWLEEGQ